MRAFNKVHVIALPRCATVSMTDALAVLGIRVAHLGKCRDTDCDEHHDHARLIRMHEQIAAGDYRLEILEECDGLADYPACIAQVYQELDRQYPGSLFINVRRDLDLRGWLQSVERQFIGLQLVKTRAGATDEERAFMQAMTAFRRMTFGQSAFDPDVYLEAYQRFQREVARYFAGREDVLLDIADVSLLQERGYELLCRFLDCPLVRGEFPRQNTHSRAPQQAFYEHLKKGSIVSQTGIVPDEV